MKRYFLTLFSALLFTAPAMHADIYMPANKNFRYKHIVLLSDWDKVIANDKGAMGKLFAGMGAVPAKKSMPILFKRGGKIANIMKSARYDGQKLKGLAANIDYLTNFEPSLKPYRNKLMVKLNGASAHKELIAYYQTLQAQGMPLVIATNNDYESLVIKTKKLNLQLRKKRLKQLTYDACYCAGACPSIKDNKAPNGMPAGSVWLGKDSDEFFTKLFTFVETELGYNREDTLFIFIDDLDKNIARARRVAHKEGVMLCAVHKNKSDHKIVGEMKQMFSTLSQHKAFLMFYNCP